MILKNNSIEKLAFVILACTALAACDTDFDNPVGDTSSYSSGDADFSNFVSIGDSLTAGYADAALYLEGQKNSYPAMLAQQFATVGGGSFNQPLVSDNLGGLLFGGNPNPDFANRLVLDAEVSSPEPIAGDPTTEVIGSGLNGSTFNNMGVPGAKLFHLGAAGYGNPAGLSIGAANPYFVRFASSANTSMIADAAVLQQPSFFVMWAGNNDVLSYATSGGIGENQLDPTVSPADYGSNDITNPLVFASIYSDLIAAMTAAGGKGVLVNIPDVKTIPYFTTVPYNPVPLDQATADTLNAAYAPYNGGLLLMQQNMVIDADEVAQRTITFSAGLNAVVIMDEELTDLTGVIPGTTDGLINMRQATASDLLVLTTSSKIGTLANPADPTSAWGVGVPLQDEDVLIPEEQESVETARAAYNAAIKSAADGSDNLLHVDAAALMEEMHSSGLSYGTGFADATYATGGAFSLDGVHPTARGYAIIANEIIDTINIGFNANVPAVDPGSYTTIFIK